MADLGKCSACGVGGSGIRLDNRPYCDRCVDRRLAGLTGWPLLPDPPAAEVIVGPDGQEHLIRYRLLRTPARVLVLAEEVRATSGVGYRLEMDCGHFDDARRLLPRIKAEMLAAIARPFLKLNELDSWDLKGDEVGGYLADDVAREDFGPPRVLIDGHALSWEEFGLALTQYVGWSFQLHLGGNLPSRVDGTRPETIEARPATAAELRTMTPALCKTDGAFIILSSHYPTPAQWAEGRPGLEDLERG